MNLENLNVVHLNTLEVLEVEGGCERCYWFGFAIRTGNFFLAPLAYIL